jgi:hypothetical protein
MQPIKKELYNFISHNLYELTWHRDYPMHHGIAIWGLLEGLRESGIPFAINKETKSVTFHPTYAIGENLFSFEKEMTFEEILRGWDRHPLGLPRAIYDSITNLVEHTGKGLEIGDPLREEWHALRLTEPSRIRRVVETHWVPWFDKYQEHILVPTSGKMPELGKPKLFFKVLDEIPLDPIRLISMARLDKPSSGPCADNMVGYCLSDFDEYYCPSESTILDYFWGYYLYALAEEKGYNLGQGSREENLEYLLRAGWDALPPTSTIDWAGKKGKAA